MSSHVTVRQTSSGGHLTWRVGGRQNYFFSLQGVLRIIEIILVLIVLIMARAGDKVLTA